VEAEDADEPLVDATGESSVSAAVNAGPPGEFRAASGSRFPVFVGDARRYEGQESDR